MKEGRRVEFKTGKEETATGAVFVLSLSPNEHFSRLLKT